MMSASLPRKRKKSAGQVLLSIIVSIAIFSILAHAIFTLIKTSYQFTNLNRARITARHLAQEKLELIRNLPYEDIGTIGGIPDGPIEQQEVVNRNGLAFSVKTSIIYIDDTFDDLAPTDLLPTDYKRIRVNISWEGLAASRSNPIVQVSDIAPRGVETTVGGGTLSILVFDANAQPVPQADVKIVASSTTPAVDLTLQTGDNGRIILPGAPVCTDCYEITVTKDGYSSERTYSTSEIANPNKPHQTILEGDLTEISFAIDQLSSINIASVNDRSQGFTPAAAVGFEMRGSKTLGTDTLGDPVYKFDQSLVTNESGTLAISNLEWDSYQISVPAASSWDISGTNPFIPLLIDPESSYSFSFAVTAHSSHSLLASFIDTSQTPIASVTAILSDGGGYTEEVISGGDANPDFGQSFFSSLSEITYQLSATASGYVDFSGSIPVSGRRQETIILTPE